MLGFMEMKQPKFLVHYQLHYKNNSYEEHKQAGKVKNGPTF